ncbi:MAG TPA: exosome complex RNA-binding protein Rrp4 [Candidatus Nanoarchaeia archaeon]|nr:exosome complex RNA-binding protein Rrp4 [Candidatus Nanoarchaeia archaeon]
MTERKIVIPGEVIAKGEEYLPGEWTEKKGGEIVSLRYGLAEEINRLVKVIPLSGVYIPRRGNVVIGKVDNITFNGWVIDLGTAETAFLSLMEVPRFVSKDALEEEMDIGDIAIVKIVGVNKRGIDVSIKLRGLGRVDDGMIITINPNKVPRVIGKEGSMIKMIKDETGCDITVGQNGLIWIIGSSVEKELYAKEAIMFVSEKSFVTGLTDELKKWFEEKKK